MPRLALTRRWIWALPLWSLLLPLQAASPPTQTPDPGVWQERQEAFGQVAAQAESRIRLPFPLRVEAVEIAPGQSVKRGEVLLRFRAPRLIQELAAYEDAGRKARIAARWAQTLRRNDKGKTVPHHDLITALQEQAASDAALTAAWDTLASDLSVLGPVPKRTEIDRQLTDKTARKALQDRLGVLRASFAGVVLNRPPPLGAWVEADTPLVELEDLSRVFVSVGVPEADLQRWHEGQDWALFNGTRIVLTRLDGIPGIDRASGLRLLRFTADNPDGRLQDGEWVRVVHRATATPVLWLPEAAVVSRGGRSWCLVPKGDRIEPVAVVVGSAEQGRVPVRSGLKAGQAVVVEGTYEWLYRDLKDLIRFVD